MVPPAGCFSPAVKTVKPHYSLQGYVNVLNLSWSNSPAALSHQIRLKDLSWLCHQSFGSRSVYSNLFTQYSISSASAHLEAEGYAAYTTISVTLEKPTKYYSFFTTLQIGSVRLHCFECFSHQSIFQQMTVPRTG